MRKGQNNRQSMVKWLEIICFQKGNPLKQTYFEFRHWLRLKSPFANWLEERRLAKYSHPFASPYGGWSTEPDSWADVTEERLDAGCYPHLRKKPTPLYKSKRQ